jgi:hypothetical protein
LKLELFDSLNVYLLTNIDTYVTAGLYDMTLTFVIKTSPKGFSASKCGVGNWIFSKFLGGIFGRSFLVKLLLEKKIGGHFWKELFGKTFFGKKFLGGFLGGFILGGIFGEEFFGRNFLGEIFWEEFFVYMFKVCFLNMNGICVFVKILG